MLLLKHAAHNLAFSSSPGLIRARNPLWKLHASLVIPARLPGHACERSPFEGTKKPIGLFWSRDRPSSLASLALRRRGDPSLPDRPGSTSFQKVFRIFSRDRGNTGVPRGRFFRGTRSGRRAEGVENADPGGFGAPEGVKLPSHGGEKGVPGVVPRGKGLEMSV